MIDQRTLDIVAIARYLNVAPWDLEAHPEWIEKGRACMKHERHQRRREPQAFITFDVDKRGVPIPFVDAVSTKRVY